MLFLFSVTRGTVSGWWAPACLALGLFYAWLLYKQPVSLSKKYRYLLFTCRAVCISILALLLVSPLVKSINYNPQKPLILILQDNSESVKVFKSSGNENNDKLTGDLAALKNTLGDQYEVQEFNFDKDLNPGLTKKI